MNNLCPYIYKTYVSSLKNCLPIAEQNKYDWDNLPYLFAIGIEQWVIENSGENIEFVDWKLIDSLTIESMKNVSFIEDSVFLKDASNLMENYWELNTFGILNETNPFHIFKYLNDLKIPVRLKNVNDILKIEIYINGSYITN